MNSRIVNIAVKQKGKSENVSVTFTRTNGYTLSKRTYTNSSLLSFDMLGWAISGAVIAHKKETARSAVYEIIPQYTGRRIRVRINTMLAK